MANYYDSPAPEIKYTWRDLEVPADVAASYGTLMRYSKHGSNTLHIALPDNVMNLTTEAWPDLLPYADEIEQVWNDCKVGRQYIRDLDRFEYITDWNNPEQQPDFTELNIPSFSLLRDLARTYNLYAALCIQQERSDEGIEVITQHYSVAHKSLEYSTTLVSRMVFFATVRTDLQTAYRILQHGNLNEQQLQRMKTAFPPISAEDVSLFRQLLGEYVMCQHCVDVTTQETAKNPSPKEFLIRRHTSPRSLIFKPNQTRTFFKNIYEPALDLCAEGSDPTPLFEEISNRNEAYQESQMMNPWNITGKMLIKLMAPASFKKAHRISQIAKIKSDLLTLEIHRRLNEPLKLTDPYSGADYQFNETRQCFYSTGPDGIQDTADDIYINKPAEE